MQNRSSNPSNHSPAKTRSILEPQVFIDYVNLYEAYRNDSRSTAMGRVKVVTGMLAATLKREDPVDIQINAIIRNVISELNTAKTFEEWYQLIFTLRLKAEDCKKLKTTNDVSLSWLTLHALAGFIIQELDRANNDLKNRIQSLKDEIAEREAYNDRCLEDIDEVGMQRKQKQRGRQGKGVAENNKKIQELICDLAMLGDPKYINKAVREHLIDHLVVTDATELNKYNAAEIGNYAAPLCLQRKLCEWLYKTKYQSLKNVDFARFIENSLKKGIIHHQEKAIEEEVDIQQQEKLKRAYLEKEKVEKKLQEQKPLLEIQNLDRSLSPALDIEKEELEEDQIEGPSSLLEEESESLKLEPALQDKLEAEEISHSQPLDEEATEDNNTPVEVEEDNELPSLSKVRETLFAAAATSAAQTMDKSSEEVPSHQP